MDFRIIEIEGHQILLERIEDDGRWLIVLGVYVDQVNRFDEWIDCMNYEHVRASIADFDPEEARLFLGRARAWWQQEYARKAWHLPINGMSLYN